METESMISLRALLELINTKNSWGKNELKEAILWMIAEQKENG